MSEQLLWTPAATDARHQALRVQIGARVRSRRKSLGISRQQLAEALSVSHEIISNYENGKLAVPPVSMFELSKILGVSIAFFFTGKVDPLNVSENSTATIGVEAA